jgi:hypothetical protein
MRGVLRRRLPRTRRGRVLLLLTVIGAVLTIVGMAGFAQGSGSYVPTCDGHRMYQGDSCAVYSSAGGSGVYTYDQMVTDHYRHLQILFGVALPLTVILGGVTLVEVLRNRRK